MKRIFKSLAAWKTRLAVLVFGLATISLAASKEVYAQATTTAASTGGGGNIISSFFGGILGSAIAWVVYVINYIIATIFGVFISIIAWFIGIVIQININIVNTPIVQNGFTITLSLANLGFVLVVIVMAIMTILRYETYALKKTLWKLVAAAILVNFSLVICAAILNFSDNLTMFFLNGFTQGCTTGTVTASGSGTPGALSNPFDCFATSVAGAFAPQRVFLQPGGGDFLGQNAFKGAGGTGQSFAGVITPLLNLFFPTLFLIVAVIALCGLFIMLLIRYIYLGILLILMPMAWLCWIFPLTSNQWHKWWSKFIQWTMFAPIIMFFIYLSILSLGVNDNSNPTAFLAALRVQPAPEGSGLVGSIGTFIGNATNNVVGTFLGNLLQMAMMVAMLFAGLFMANSMGITFADTAMKGMTAVTSGFGRFAGRRGKLIGGAAMDKLGVKKGAERLQANTIGTGLMGVGKGRGRILSALSAPIRGVGRGLNFGIGIAGRGMEAVHTATREDMVKDAQKRIGSETSDQLAHGMTTFTSAEKIAALVALRERGDLDKLENRMQTYMDEEMFNTFGQKGAYKDLDYAWLSNSAMRDAASSGQDSEILRMAAAQYVRNLKTADIAKGKNWDEIFNNEEYGGMDVAQKRALNVAQIRAMAETNENLIPAIISRLKAENLGNFETMYREAVAGLPREQQLRTRFDDMIYYNLFGHHQQGAQAQAGQQNNQPPPAAGAAHP